MDIADIENVLIEINNRYVHPQCFLVALLLSHRFDGEIFYDGNHCITLIDNNFYDKSGQIDIREVITKNYLSMVKDSVGIRTEFSLMDALIEKHQEQLKLS